MKKIISIAVCVIALMSCSKDETPPTPTPPPAPNPTAASFSWKENGAAYTADSAWFYTTTRVIAYSGAGANQRTVSISFPATTTGVFQIPPTFFGYSVGGPSSPAVNGTTGTLTITTYNNTTNLLSGTFVNITAGSRTITDGTFTNLPKR